VTATGDTFCDKGHPLTIAKPKFPAALYRVAIAPKTQADAAKISPTLTKLCEEDMTLIWQNDPITHETVLQGMGDQHIDVAIHRAQAKFQVGLGRTSRGFHTAKESHAKPARNIVTRSRPAARVSSARCICASSRCPPLILNSTDELVGMNLSKSYLAPIEKGSKPPWNAARSRVTR
jgi:hypothetical protein